MDEKKTIEYLVAAEKAMEMAYQYSCYNEDIWCIGDDIADMLDKLGYDTEGMT